MRILAIESSCDETAVAVFDEQHGLLAHELFSQVDLHQIYGGVVPELAARDHVRRLIPLLQAALKKAHTEPRQLHAVAYTAGPGLVGALLTGAAFARSLAYGWQIPAVAVHHLEGHLLAPQLEVPAPPIPHVALLVSGGHTQLLAVRDCGNYELLGETRDDAAGEAFDKAAKLLGLPYPGGPQLSQLAQGGIPGAVNLPRPMLNRPNLEFSFSGLKTAVLHAVREMELTETRKRNIAHAVQEAIVEILVVKASLALQRTGYQHLVVSGGVSANQRLRTCFGALESKGIRVYFPRLEFCTDNAAMIAVAGMLRLKHGQHSDLAIRVQARWPLASLPTVIA
jgi:N6-L-threonylcarbamoyladenine synthase